jgi:hypothetical protein
MPQKINTSTLLISASIITAGSLMSFGGDLDPTLPPAPTMHTLDEIYDTLLAASTSTPPTWEVAYVPSLSGSFQLAVPGAGVVHGCWLTELSGPGAGSFFLSDGSDPAGEFCKFTKAWHAQGSGAVATTFKSEFFELNVPFTDGLYARGGGVLTILYSTTGS